MSNLPIVDILSALSESLFHIEEKKRLKALKQHNDDREHSAHIDPIDKVHDDAHRADHEHRMEHHGHVFWTYYYPGERPDAVLENHPLPTHEYDTEEQKFAIEAHMLDPEYSAYDPLTAKESHSPEFLSKKRWTGLLWVAEAALNKKNYFEAESAFRAALKETHNFEVSEVGLSRTLSGLAKCLCKVDKHEEAEKLYSRILELDEHILGHGNPSMEEEFYSIARHFVDQHRFMEVVEVFNDLLERLNTSVGPRDPMVARCLNELGVVFCKQRNFSKAEPLFERAIEILQQYSGSRNKQQAVTMQNLAKVFDATDRHDAAENMLRQAIKLLESESVPVKQE